MKVATVLAGLTAGLLSVLPHGAAQEPPAKPPELKVLERWVGTWTSEVTSKPALWDREGSQWKGGSTERLALNGRFLHTTVKSKSKQGTSEFIGLRTYDQERKTFRTWSFWVTDKSSGTVEFSGQWDEDTKAMSDKSVDPDSGTTATSKTTFTDKDRFEFTHVVKDKGGQVLLDRHGTVRRKKAAPDELKEDQEQQAQAKSPELKVLERLVGTWDAKAVSKPAEWTPTEVRTTSKITRKWVLDGRFLQDTSEISDGSEGLSLFTYDPQMKAYQSWWFSSEGHTSKSTGQWDAASETISFKADLGNGLTSRGSVRFLDKDHHDWKVVVQDGNGKLYFHGEWYVTRRKK